MAADNWENIISLLTGWTLPKRDDVTGAKGDGGIPWMNVDIKSIPANPHPTNAPHGDGMGWTFQFYSGSWNHLGMYQADITYKNIQPGKDFWERGQFVLWHLVNNNFQSINLFDDVGGEPGPGEGVDLHSFRLAAKSFDDAGAFFVNQTQTLKQWVDAFGSEDAAWKGTAAGVFWHLINDLHDMYENYSLALRPPGFSPQHTSPSTGYVSTTLHGDSLIGAEESLWKAYKSLDEAHSKFFWLNGSPVSVYLPDSSQNSIKLPADPRDILNGLMEEIGNWLVAHNWQNVRGSTTKSVFGGNTTWLAAPGFSDTMHWGKLSDTSTWSGVANEATGRWRTNVETNLDAPARPVVTELQQNWSRVMDPNWNTQFAFKDTSHTDLNTEVENDINQNKLNDGGGSGGDGGSNDLTKLGGGSGGDGGLPNDLRKLGGGSGGDGGLPNDLTTPGGSNGGLPGDGGLPNDLTTPGGSNGGLPGGGLVPPSLTPGGSNGGLPGAGGQLPSYTNADGSIATRNPDGSVTTKFPDGSWTTVSPDGTVKTVMPDGRTVTSKLAPGQKLTNPDGSTTTVGQDGSVSTRFPDGSNFTAHPDGSTTTVGADGTKTTTFPNGLVEKVGANGHLEITSPDGAVTTQQPDGSVTTRFPGGGSTIVSPDGTVHTVTPDGKDITSHIGPGQQLLNPDGSSTTVDSSGAVVTHLPDGSSFTVHPDGTVSTDHIPSGEALGGGSLGGGLPADLLTQQPALGGNQLVSNGLTTLGQDGSVTTHFPSGASSVTGPGGVTTTTFPDGSSTVSTPDGRFQTLPSPDTAAAAGVAQAGAGAVPQDPLSGLTSAAGGLSGFVYPMMMMASMARQGQGGQQKPQERVRETYEESTSDGAFIHHGGLLPQQTSEPNEVPYEEEEEDGEELFQRVPTQQESAQGTGHGQQKAVSTSTDWRSAGKVDVWGTGESGLPASIGR